MRASVHLRSRNTTFQQLTALQLQRACQVRAEPTRTTPCTLHRDNPAAHGQPNVRNFVRDAYVISAIIAPDDRRADHAVSAFFAACGAAAARLAGGRLQCRLRAGPAERRRGIGHCRRRSVRRLVRRGRRGRVVRRGLWCGQDVLRGGVRGSAARLRALWRVRPGLWGGGALPRGAVPLLAVGAGVWAVARRWLWRGDVPLRGDGGVRAGRGVSAGGLCQALSYQRMVQARPAPPRASHVEGSPRVTVLAWPSAGAPR